MRILEDNDFHNLDALSDAARAIHTKMSARAAAKARKIGKEN